MATTDRPHTIAPQLEISVHRRSTETPVTGRLELAQARELIGRLSLIDPGDSGVAAAMKGGGPSSPDAPPEEAGGEAFADPFDVPPVDHMVVIHNDDRPGVIGTVGTLLGQAEVNIADMDVSRTDDDKAVMLIAPTKPVPASVLDEIRVSPSAVTAFQRFPALSLERPASSPAHSGAAGIASTAFWMLA